MKPQPICLLLSACSWGVGCQFSQLAENKLDDDHSSGSLLLSLELLEKKVEGGDYSMTPNHHQLGAYEAPNS